MSAVVVGAAQLETEGTKMPVCLARLTSIAVRRTSANVNSTRERPWGRLVRRSNRNDPAIAASSRAGGGRRDVPEVRSAAGGARKVPPGIMPHLTALVSVKMRHHIWEMKGMSSQPNSCTSTLSALPFGRDSALRVRGQRLRLKNIWRVNSVAGERGLFRFTLPLCPLSPLW